MEKKYILTEETKEVGGHILHRIQAMRDFGGVQKGDLGGWIESEENLSHDGDCWIFGNGEVFDNGRVFGDGRVSDNGWVFGDGKVFGDAVLIFLHLEFLAQLLVLRRAVHDIEKYDVCGDTENCDDGKNYYCCAITVFKKGKRAVLARPIEVI